MLVDTAGRDLGVDLFGRRHATPLLVSPIGVLSAAHADADLAVARGAREQGVIPVLSTQASVPMEQVAAELGGSGHWYQLYWSRDADLADVVEATVAALGIEGSGPARAFNVGGGSRATVAELVALVGEALGEEPRVVYGPPVPGDVRSTWADLSRARRELGYAPRVSLEDGVRQQVRWAVAGCSAPRVA